MFVVLAHPFMKAFLIALSCFTYFQAAAQSYFVFAEPAKRELAQKPFQKVLVLDKRKDTGAVAKLKFAAEKGYELLGTAQSFTTVFGDYCQKTLSKKDESEQELVVLVYRFFAEELDSNDQSNTEFGLVRFSADFFVKGADDRYRLLGASDGYAFASAYNVTDELIHAAGSAIVAGYQSVRKQASPSDLYYSWDYVKEYDRETQKRNLPFSGTLPESAYFGSWNDFLAMRSQADIEVRVTEKEVAFYRIRKNEKKTKLFNAPGLLFVWQGKAYYRINYSYWELERRGGDFYLRVPVILQRYSLYRDPVFYGFGSVNGRSKLGTYQLGYYNSFYECMINPRTGDPLLLKELASKGECSPHLSAY